MTNPENSSKSIYKNLRKALSHNGSVRPYTATDITVPFSLQLAYINAGTKGGSFAG